MDAETWAAIGSIASAVAGLAAVYVARRVGKTQAHLAGIQLVKDIDTALNSVEMRKVRRAVGEAYLAGKPIPETELEYVLNIFEPIADPARDGLVSTERIWQSVMGDLVPAYVKVGKEHIAKLQSHHASYFECCMWLDGRIRRRTYWRGGKGAIRRLCRHGAWWCTADMSEEDVRRVMKGETEMDIPSPISPLPPPPPPPMVAPRPDGVH